MEKSLEFRTIEQFNQYYFPKAFERDKLEKMTPKQYGEYLAQQTLDYIQKILR